MNYIVISSNDSKSDDDMESGWDAGCESVDEFGEIEVQEMREKGKAFLETIKPLKNLYNKLRMGLKGKEWKKIKANQSLGYNGQAEWTKQQHHQKAQKGEEQHQNAKHS